MSLITELESQDKKGLFRSNDNVVCYPTGISVLDYANGYSALPTTCYIKYHVRKARKTRIGLYST